MMVPPKDLEPLEHRALLDNLAQLEARRPRAIVRSNFYNTKQLLDNAGFSIPPSMKSLETVLGWPAKTCDALGSRLHLGGFVMPGEAEPNEDLADMFAMNSMELEWPQTQISTFQHGCSFVAVTPGDVGAGEPPVLIQPMAATEATGLWDVRKRKLSSAVWAPGLEDTFSSSGIMGNGPRICILFLLDRTVTMTRDITGPWKIERIPNTLPRLPVTVVRYRPQLSRPFGMSRISRAVMYLTKLAARTLLRSEVSSEFYSSPQRWMMGADEESFTDEEGNAINPWETILGKVWLMGRDEEGNIPTVGQFDQSSPQPHIEQMKMITTLFAGETSLPVSTLGIVHDNPASAEAIDAAWADLVGVAELSQVELGAAAVEVAQNTLMTLNGETSLPREWVRLKAKWRDASTPTRAAMADATTKQVTAGILRPDSVVALEQLGYSETDIVRIRAEHEAARLSDPLSGIQSLLNPGLGVVPPAVPQGQIGATNGQPAVPASPAPPQR